MPDWFTKARETITRRPGAAAPQPFERPCVCGETICGERLPQAREVACPSCGREWFILPRDVYPRAKRRSPGPSLWKRFRTGGSSAEMATVSDENGRPASAETGVATAAAPARPKKPPVRQRVKQGLSAARHAAAEKAKRAARPLRLVGAGIGVLVLLTGMWLWHRARVDAASATLVAVVPQAEEALAERDFAKAERLFGEAASAVDVLGAHDETAANVRQRHRELVALNQLAGKTPYDLAAEAEALAASPGRWAEEFAGSYGGRWVVLDVPLGAPQAATPIEAAADSEDADQDAAPRGKVVRLDLPLMVGDRPVRLEIAAETFQRLGKANRAIVAAQYDSWRLHQGANDAASWVVGFRPGTAFLWGSADTYAALGFDVDDPVGSPRAVLERQRKALELPTEEVNRQDAKSAKEERS